MCLPWGVVFVWHPLVRLVYFLLASATKVLSAWSGGAAVIGCMTHCVIHSQQLLCSKDADSNAAVVSHFGVLVALCVKFAVFTLMWPSYSEVEWDSVLRRFDRVCGPEGKTKVRAQNTGTHQGCFSVFSSLINPRVIDYTIICFPHCKGGENNS